MVNKRNKNGKCRNLILQLHFMMKNKKLNFEIMILKNLILMIRNKIFHKKSNNNWKFNNYKCLIMIFRILNNNLNHFLKLKDQKFQKLLKIN